MILAAIQMNWESAPMGFASDGLGVDATDFGVSRSTLGIYAADLGVATDRALGNRRGGFWGFARDFGDRRGGPWSHRGSGFRDDENEP